MKKIAIIGVCLLFFGATFAAATTRPLQQITQPTTLEPTGSFEGMFGYKQMNQNWTVVGTMEGNYTARNRGTQFIGEWTARNYTGTMQGGFSSFLLLGRISAMINGTQRTLPIVGFIFTNSTHFVGRFMSFIGPALYFYGTHT